MSSLVITNGKILVGKEYVNGNLEIVDGIINRIGDFNEITSIIKMTPT